jgi:hypothetical protein
MSAQVSCGCEATISEKDPRAEIWMKVFGKLSFPLKHPLTNLNSNFPDKIFYSGDATALTAEQKTKLIEAMTKKFNIPASKVEESFKDGIIPILAENVILSICELHTRLIVMSEDEMDDSDLDDSYENAPEEYEEDQ